MRTLITLALICAALCASAQRPTRRTLPPVPVDSPAKEQSAGELLTKGAKQKNTALVTALMFGAAGAAVAAGGRDGAAEVGAGIAGAGLFAGIVLTMSGNSKHAKAGRLLKAKGY